jgi:hypothetical protein
MMVGLAGRWCWRCRDGQYGGGALRLISAKISHCYGMAGAVPPSVPFSFLCCTPKIAVDNARWMRHKVGVPREWPRRNEGLPR